MGPSGSEDNRCAVCGQPLAPGANFCGHCGSTRAPRAAAPLAPAGETTGPEVQVHVPHAPTSSPVNVGAQTVLQMPRPAVPAQPATAVAQLAQPQAPPAPAPAAAHAAPSKQTMIGMASPWVTPAAAMPGGPPPPAPADLRPSKNTMLGVAMPGIAPTRTGEAAAQHPPVGPVGPARPVPDGSPAAPLPPHRAHAATLPLQVAYVPPPEPLRELPAPPPPKIIRKKGGFPIAVVGLVMGVLVLASGVVLAVFWKSAPPITGQARVSPDAKDLLHLSCDARSCKDGTVVSIGSTKAVFSAGEADLPLVTPLHVGDNTLDLMVDRPGIGRDETVRLVVPVAYRVSADVTTMAAPHPSITIRVEAHPGDEVTVDGKPVALDPNGAGAHAVDETAATEGPADESRVVSADVPYTIAARGRAPDKGKVSARVAVAPLRVDAPGARAIVDEDKVLVAGRAAKGASVTVDGAPATVGPDGAFETLVPLPAPGDRTIEVRGGTGTLMPRTVHVAVTRVSSLAEAAKAFEQQPQKPLGYDAVMADLAGKTGQPVVVEGQVLESRGSGHRTLALVDDRRGCAHGPCLTRVIIGRDLALAHGEVLKAYGVVARGFLAPSGQTIPEVDSAFVVRAAR